jgi:hypothetical protein
MNFLDERILILIDPAVLRLHAQVDFQVVEENETLLSFAFFLKKQQSFATSSMTQHQVAHPVAK